MSTHPLDLHPLASVAAAAWAEVKKAHQPAWEGLPIAVKSELLDTAARVKSGDPTVAFEVAVAGRLVAAPVVEVTPGVEPEVGPAAEPEPEPTTAEEKEHLDLKGKLPADFPAHDKLHDGGVNTYGQLNKIEDLLSISGVGPATAKLIKKRLKADAKTLNEGVE